MAASVWRATTRRVDGGRWTPRHVRQRHVTRLLEGPGGLRRSLEDWSAPARLIVEHKADVVYLTLSPDAAQVATSDLTREILIWPTAGRSKQPDRVLLSPASVVGVGYDATGRWLQALTFERGYPAIVLFDLTAPAGADPLVLHKGDTSSAGAMAFAPSGHWLATTHGVDVAFWPLGIAAAAGAPNVNGNHIHFLYT